MTVSVDFDVLGLGVVAVDDLIYVDAYPAADEKVRVRRRHRQCGGLTGTALVAAARLGARSAYVGTLGGDPLSRVVAECFEREGIDLAHAVRRPDARPGHSTIIVGQEHHTRNVFSYVEGHFGPDPTRPDAEVIRRAKVLLVDHHGMEGTLRAARIARESGVAVVADLERHAGSLFDEVLALVDHLVLPERFAKQLTGASTAEESVRRLWTPERRAVVVTAGSRGCWFIASDGAASVEHVAAFAVEVTDTTGCGDVFHGAYCAALAEGLAPRERLLTASAAAALKATCHGGQSGIPTRADVDAFLRRTQQGRETQ